MYGICLEWKEKGSLDRGLKVGNVFYDALPIIQRILGTLLDKRKTSLHK